MDPVETGVGPGGGGLGREAAPGGCSLGPHFKSWGPLETGTSLPHPFPSALSPQGCSRSFKWPHRSTRTENQKVPPQSCA